jgi:hypothetical protein
MGIQYQYRGCAREPWQDIEGDDVPRDEREQCDDMIDPETGISEVILAHHGEYRAYEV